MFFKGHTPALPVYVVLCFVLHPSWQTCDVLEENQENKHKAVLLFMGSGNYHSEILNLPEERRILL